MNEHAHRDAAREAPSGFRLEQLLRNLQALDLELFLQLQALFDQRRGEGHAAALSTAVSAANSRRDAAKLWLPSAAWARKPRQAATVQAPNRMTSATSTGTR